MIDANDYENDLDPQTKIINDLYNLNDSNPQSDESSQSEDIDIDEAEMQEYLTKDSAAKFQFDYNRNTCFTNDAPELDVQDKPISVAPGQGKVPTCILLDKEWDSKTHPFLDPTGQNNLNHDRVVNLKPQQFFEQQQFTAIFTT